ncbi:MAG: SDR family oxidoreductase [Nitrospina sp.]|jgi:nucleoside-diphosphate-sugar epimerase|nr:SDR family oxidoreductase [Nitrospina sp.]MBT5631895.1 SDR family oxidoreductase [Nitrospina sp.]
MPDSSSAGQLFCFGLGFSSLALAEKLLPKGWKVSGTYRGSEKQDTIQVKNSYLFDGAYSTPEISAAISQATHLLIAIPPQPSGDVVLKHFGEAISKASHLRWIGYLSSTGVYGDSQGEWVDETSPLLGSTELNRRRIEVESAWLKMGSDHGLPVMIFRCVGIYGPGRNLLVSVKQGRARRIDKPGLVFSRIHTDDLAQTLEASMETPQPGEVYNVSDDCPCPPAEAVEYACDLLGIEPPPLVPYEEADLSPTARGFYETNKRILNKKIKEQLGVKLRYPDYRSGLDALLKGF